MKKPTNYDGRSVASHDLFADLIEQWERRCVALDRLAEDAETTACEETIARLKTKAGVTRSMTVELKRELRKANAESSHGVVHGQGEGASRCRGG